MEGEEHVSHILKKGSLGSRLCICRPTAEIVSLHAAAASPHEEVLQGARHVRRVVPENLRRRSSCGFRLASCPPPPVAAARRCPPQSTCSLWHEWGPAATRAARNRARALGFALPVGEVLQVGVHLGGPFGSCSG